MEYLSKQQENFCETSGIFGLLITLSCLIQHLLFMIPHWITISMIGVYVLCLAGFILLMKKSVAAAPLLLTSAILVFLMEVLMVVSLTFSLVLLILLVYLVIIVAIIYGGDIRTLIKKKRMAEREENAKWEGIL